MGNRSYIGGGLLWSFKDFITGPMCDIVETGHIEYPLKADCSKKCNNLTDGLNTSDSNPV